MIITGRQRSPFFVIAVAQLYTRQGKHGKPKRAFCRIGKDKKQNQYEVVDT